MDTSKLSGNFQIIVGICITMAAPLNVPFVVGQLCVVFECFDDDDNITDVLDEVSLASVEQGRCPLSFYSQ